MANTTNKSIELTEEERQDAKYALAYLANEDESKAAHCNPGSQMKASLLAQCERLRALARKLSA